jgi:hypothetical protein
MHPVAETAMKQIRPTHNIENRRLHKVGQNIVINLPDGFDEGDFRRHLFNTLEKIFRS